MPADAGSSGSNPGQHKLVRSDHVPDAMLHLYMQTPGGTQGMLEELEDWTELDENDELEDDGAGIIAILSLNT